MTFKMVEVKMYSCDEPGCKYTAESWMATCFGNCGKTFCYQHGVQFRHGVYTSGSGDAVYCKECYERLLGMGDRLLLSYRTIQKLRKELEKNGEDWKKRIGDAEAEWKLRYGEHERAMSAAGAL
jgi:hypothetical protein